MREFLFLSADAQMLPAPVFNAAATGESGARPTRRRSRAKFGHEGETMSTQQATTPQISNTPSFDDIVATVTELGKQAGQGRDTWTKFLYEVIEKSFLGGLDVTSNKHGKDREDAVVLSEAYVKAQTGATIFDAKAPNQRKTISCTRTGIRLGMYTKGGMGEPLATVDKLLTIRQKLRADPAYSKKLDDAANMMLRFAREQLKRDRMIPESELRQFCFKRQSDPQTVEDYWVAMRKKAMNVKVGKGDVHDNDPAIDAVIAACNKRLKAIATQKGVASANGTQAAA